MSEQHTYDGYNVRFFKHLDTPLMIFIFESDEFIVGMIVYLSTMILAAVLGIALPGGVFLYAILSLLSMLGYIKFKKTRPSGYMNGRLFKLGIIHVRSFGFKRFLTKKEKNFKVLPYGFLNEFRGN
ncbi:type IV conjugative transfer system protein TraL (plasmid) [Aliarcobacter lanthieri]|uniref:type IV conjugative transfer system protein TraL n=1 Tax=Aliarcobacter lanthieri TaxID=1355374 RepID=UPI003AAA911C